jgi:NADH-quinone oxidoreductase subunit A
VGLGGGRPGGNAGEAGRRHRPRLGLGAASQEWRGGRSKISQNRLGFMNDYIPVLIMVVLAAATAAGMLVATSMIGPKKKFADKMEPFECGESPIVSPKLRFSVKFYLVALFFVIFDIEAVFVYPWAVLFKDLGVFGFIEMMIFLTILAIGLIYVWRRGALEWD